MNIATSWNGISSELVFVHARGSVTTKQGFVQEKDMTSRLFALTVAAAMAIGGSAIAAGYSSSAPAKATTAQSTAAADKLTTKEMNAAVALDKVGNAQSTLTMAKVDDHSGHNIGEVKSVVTGASGAPTAIHVDVGNNHVVSMDAKNLTYIPDRKIVLTRMSKAQAEKLPAAKG
jgi:predicted porin